jgi:hypothetical protein
MLRFGLKVGVVAVAPIDTAMGCEVRRSQHPPETRTTPGPETPLMEDGDQVVKAPVRGRAVGRGGVPGGHRQHIQTRCGGKSAAVAPDAAHLAGHCGPAPGSDGANGPPSGGSSGAPGRPEGATGGPVRHAAGSTGNARPRLGGWNGHAQAAPNETVHRYLKSRGAQEVRASSHS